MVERGAYPFIDGCEIPTLALVIYMTVALGCISNYCSDGAEGGNILGSTYNDSLGIGSRDDCHQGKHGKAHLGDLGVVLLAATYELVLVSNWHLLELADNTAVSCEEVCGSLYFSDA
jgi:hypothetical protein